MQNITTDPLDTPVYLKEKDFVWPTKDKLFYLMTADGLMICRNHMWFRSSALSKVGPNYLEKHKESCTLTYPSIPKALVEKAVGFFLHIYEKKHWESALILAFNRTTKQMELVCPEQKASHGSVNYDIPNLPTNLALIGDLHSHCNFSPNPSWTDQDDEMNRPGLHIVVGYLDKKKPEFYCAAVVDGCRFEAKIDDVIEGYDKPDPEEAIPVEWMQKVKEKVYAGWSGGHSDSSYDYGNWRQHDAEIDKNDLLIKERILTEFRFKTEKPKFKEVQEALFRQTRNMSYLETERIAQEFIDDWGKKGVKHEEHVGKE